MALISVENLCKTYTRSERARGTLGAVAGLFRRKTIETHALRDLTFSVSQGELVGYIGPNGAGKSTTVKLLSGIIVPTSGRCTVDGLVPWESRKAHVAKIGVVFGQRPQLWWDLPVAESYDLLRDIYSLDKDEYRRTRDELVDRMGIGGFMDQPVRQLSLGQRMRADLVASLLHRPRILFLDEPTIGLDAPGKLAVRDFVRTINREHGVTVVLTTHDMDDIEALATRLLVIGNGRIIADGTIEMLHHDLGLQRRIVAHIDPSAPIDPSAQKRLAEHVDEAASSDGQVDMVRRATPAERALADRVRQADGTYVRGDGQVEVTLDPSRLSVPDVLAMITSAFTVRDVFIDSAPIEEIVSRIYARDGVEM